MYLNKSKKSATTRTGRPKRKRTNNKRREQSLLVFGPGALRTYQPVANSITVTLRYQDPDWIYGNPSGYVWSMRFKMNSAYDPDPHYLSGSTIAYFAEYAALYRRYRVLRFGYNVTAINNTNEPVIFTVAPSKEDLGDNYTNLDTLVEINKGKSDALSQNGTNNKRTFRGTVNLPTYSGYPGYLTDDICSADVDSDPTNLYYFNIGINSYLSQSSTSFSVRSLFTYQVIFYSPKTEPIALQQRPPRLKRQLSQK